MKWFAIMKLYTITTWLIYFCRTLIKIYLIHEETKLSFEKKLGCRVRRDGHPPPVQSPK